jgi:hypothetical protein
LIFIFIVIVVGIVGLQLATLDIKLILLFLHLLSLLVSLLIPIIIAILFTFLILQPEGVLYAWVYVETPLVVVVVLPVVVWSSLARVTIWTH